MKEISFDEKITKDGDGFIVEPYNYEPRVRFTFYESCGEWASCEMSKAEMILFAEKIRTIADKIK